MQPKLLIRKINNISQHLPLKKVSVRTQETLEQHSAFFLPHGFIILHTGIYMAVLRQKLQTT